MGTRRYFSDIPLLVGYDDQSGDIPVLIVGQRQKDELSVVNALKGPEARELWEKLIGDKKESMEE